VGIYGAALKKQQLDDASYRELMATTTQLNTAGMHLGSLDGVHAMTDVTGFGLLGHLLEICRGSGVGATLTLSGVPVLERARELVGAGHVTGGSARNWQSYGDAIDLGAHGHLERALLTDPQTSGGLLVSCAPEAVADVLATFHQQGFSQAAAIGEITSGDRIIVR
jgi:selenide,water dikinase